MLPQTVQDTVISLLNGQCAKTFRNGYSRLSSCYRQFSSPSINQVEALAYACARMPATYATVEYVLNEFTRKNPDYEFRDICDIGSGTGSLMCYFSDLDIQYTAVEQSSCMINTCQKIIANNVLRPIFKHETAQKYFKNESVLHDNVFFIYSLNEISDKESVLQKAINCSRDYVFIIEAGTPVGFSIIKLAKQLAKQNSCGILAPCALDECPLAKDDWCHFNVRLPRTRLHNIVKQSSLAYEDEKFCYVILQKNNPTNSSDNRIIKRPIKKNGHVIMDLCTKDGVTRITSNKKLHRKKEWGEEL